MLVSRIWNSLPFSVISDVSPFPRYQPAKLRCERCFTFVKTIYSIFVNSYLSCIPGREVIENK
jgi:hypothetical protein